jgi:hypothetical protein
MVKADSFLLILRRNSGRSIVIHRPRSNPSDSGLSCFRSGSGRQSWTSVGEKSKTGALTPQNHATQWGAAILTDKIAETLGRT